MSDVQEPSAPAKSQRERLSIGALHTLRRALTLPPGSGILVARPARLRMALAVLAAIALSLLEVVALSALVPLMQLLAGPQATGSAIDLVRRVTGLTERGQLALALAGLVFCLYVLKAILNIALRWWQSGFINREQVRTSERLFDYYLRAPYTFHLRRGTAYLASTANDAVGQVYGLVVAGALTILSDILTIVAIVMTLLVLSPGPTLIVAAYLGVAAWGYQRWSKPRALRYGAQMMTAAQRTFRAATDGLGSVKLVKMRGNQDYFVDGYAQARWTAADASRRAAFVGELPKHLLVAGLLAPLRH